MATPITQRNRPIGFALLGGGLPLAVNLTVRPEEINYTYPARTGVVQTFAGVWMDDWGPGITEINVQGHTGWRGGLIPGEAEWLALRSMLQVFHRRRNNLAMLGLDPDTVQLFWIDTLNSSLCQVYPFEYKLRRHKARPLLFTYSIQLFVIEDIINFANGNLAELAPLALAA